MMKISVNGKEKETSAETVLALLEELNLASRPVATMVNGKIVRKDQRGETRLQAGDQVEVISMVGGG